MDTTKVTRVEVIDELGRNYVNWDSKITKVELVLQDNNKTLKIFITKDKNNYAKTLNNN